MTKEIFVFSLFLVAFALAPLLSSAADNCNGSGALATKLIPKNLKIACIQNQRFDGAKANLVMISYGKANDCAAGCFHSVVCAIESSGKADLFYALWNHSDEKPNGLPESCQQEDFRSGETGPRCRPKVLSNPIFTNKEFLNFAKKEPYHGPFRGCFNSFVKGPDLSNAKDNQGQAQKRRQIYEYTEFELEF